MAATELRNKGVDRRRLTMDQRESYRGGSRAGALARVKSYKANMAWNSKRRPFATEQKPGTGGFTGGIWQQQERLAKKVQSFRDRGSSDQKLIYLMTGLLQSINKKT